MSETATRPRRGLTALFDYENRSQPALSRRRFWRRMSLHLGYGSILVLASLMIGTTGFMIASHESFVDAFLNSSMLLGGMGPVGNLGGNWGKIFAALFALYAGLEFLVLASLILAPVFHRVLHRFHWEGKQGK